MTYTLEPQTIAIGVVALLLGLALGLALRSGLKRRVAVLSERIDGVTRERDAALVARDKLVVDLKAREAEIRPLSDEVDKLRRDVAKARARTPADAALLSGDGPTVDPLDLAQLKGVGPKFGDRLKAAGIHRIDQIAGWTTADAEVIDGQMGEFKGRIAGDRLIEQAALLTEGRYTEYETRFGKLGGAVPPP